MFTFGDDGTFLDALLQRRGGGYQQRMRAARARARACLYFCRHLRRVIGSVQIETKALALHCGQRFELLFFYNAEVHAFLNADALGFHRQRREWKRRGRGRWQLFLLVLAEVLVCASVCVHCAPPWFLKGFVTDFLFQHQRQHTKKSVYVKQSSD